MARTEPTNQEKDLLGTIKKRFELSEKYTRPFFDRFLDNYKHYLLHTITTSDTDENANYPFYFDVELPISYGIVETLLPRMVARSPEFNVKARNPDDQWLEKFYTPLIKFQWNHPELKQRPMFKRLSDGLKECFITGNAVGMVPWERRTRRVKRWKPVSSMLGVTADNLDDILDRNGWTVAGFLKYLEANGIEPEWAEAEEDEVYIDDPVFDHVSIFRFFPDPKGKSIDRMAYAFRRYYTSYADLAKENKDMGGIYKNMEHVERLAKAKDKVENTAEGLNYENEIASIFDSEDYTHKDETDHQLEVLEMWEDNRLVKVVNRKAVIREGGNPYHCGKIPFVGMHDIPIPNQFYAWGEIDPVKKIEDMMSDISNMRLDNVVRALLRMWLLDPTKLVDGEEFIPEPDNVIQVTDLNAVKPLDTQDVTASSYKELQEWHSLVQYVSGVTDYSRGSGNEAVNDTATGIELLQQAANARFAFKIQMFEKLMLEPIGHFYIEHNRQFINEERAVEITDQEWIKVGPNHLRAAKGSLDLVVESGSTEAVNERVETLKWETLMDRIGKPPFDSLAPDALDEIAKRYLLAKRITDPENIVKRVQVQPPVPGMPGQPAPAAPPSQGVVPQEKGALNEEVPVPTEA